MRDLEIGILGGLAGFGVDQQADGLRADLEWAVVGLAIFRIGSIQGVGHFGLRCALQGDLALVSRGFYLVSNFEFRGPASGRATLIRAGCVLDPEVERAFSRAEVFHILHLRIAFTDIRLGGVVDDRALSRIAGCQTENGFAGLLICTKQRDIGAGLFFREGGFFDIAIFTQAPTALFQRLGLQCVHAAVTGHPWPCCITLGAADHVFPGSATVVFSRWPEICLGHGEVFVEVILEVHRQLVVGARAGEQAFDLGLCRLVALADFQAVVDGDADQGFTSVHFVKAGEIDPVIGSRECLGEAVFRFFEAVSCLFKQGVARLEALVDLLNGVEFPQAILYRIGHVAVLTREHQ